MRPALLLLAVLTACVPPRRAGVGVECEINSQCDTPLVCRLGHCRNECATSADCAAGLSCVLDSRGLGACQLPAETSCSAPSECPAGLVCRFMQCTNECETDRDCPGGARCEMDGDGLACVDRSGAPCTFDEECDPIATGERCLSGRCRRECFSDRDCRNDFWCDLGRCTPPPRLMRDAGVVADVPRDTLTVDAPRDTLCTGAPLDDVVAIASYARHTCAITDDAGTRELYCWGDAMDAIGTSPQPTCAAPVAGLAGVVVDAVTMSNGATCLRTGAGEVRCFGFNYEGMLGRGPSAPPTDPMPVAIPAFDALRVVGGGAHFCAERTGDVIACWGTNSAGQLGVGGGPRTSPTTAMSAGHGLALGASHTCAIGTGGFPECWGDSRDGRLGTGLAAALPGVVALAANNNHTCAIDAGFVMHCWGSNGSGELGRGTMSISEAAPAAVSGLPGGPVREMSLGADHTCALVGTDAWCWGGTSIWQDGLGDVLVPRIRLAGVRAIASGFTHVCGITADAASNVVCVGQNSAGELGAGSTMNSAEPLVVLIR